MSTNNKQSDHNFNSIDNIPILMDQDQIKLTLYEMKFGEAWTSLPVENWTYSFLFTTKGLQYLHIYLWIFVDLSWMQGYCILGDVCGIAAITVGLILVIKSCISKNYDETYIYSTLLLWLCGNMWWMSGEVHDIKYPNETPVYDSRNKQSMYILYLAFLLAIVYFVVIRPFNYIKPNKTDPMIQEENKIPQKMLCFPRFKDYERIHLLFWIGKDCAWCMMLGPIWMLFFIPTYFMALDYACITLNRKHLLIEHAHYLAQFLWVTGNGIWAYGEIFSHYDAPMSLFTLDPVRWLTCRWYASWILLLALVPILTMYIIWISNTLNGKITSNSLSYDFDEQEERDQVQETLINKGIRKTSTHTLVNRVPRVESDFSLNNEEYLLNGIAFISQQHQQMLQQV